MTTISTPPPASDLPAADRHGDCGLEELLDDLRASCAGEVLLPGTAAYDAATAAWNVNFVHRPAVVVLPESTADVVAAVRFARAAGLRLGVMSTGHGTVRTADGAVLINVRRLAGVSVDPVARTARVEGGATWQPVLDAATPHGLAPLLGSTPHVGAVGYTLGGGMGWLARAHGLAIDEVRSFEVVTPDGEIRIASPDHETELFELLRGAGAGSVGIVTAMTIGLVPVDLVYGGNLLYPAEAAPEVLARWAAWSATLPEAMTTSVALFNFPPIEDVPEPLRGRSFAIVRGCYAGPVEEGEALVRPWREWCQPELDLFGPMPFAAVASISMDPEDPMPGVVSTEWLTDLGPEVAATLVGAAFGGAGTPAGPPPLIFAEVRLAGGAIARGTGGSVGNRSSELVLSVCGITPTPEAKAATTAHVAATRASLRRHVTGGTYANFTEGEEKRERTADGSAFDPAGAERRRALKAAVDPDDVMAFGVALG